MASAVFVHLKKNCWQAVYVFVQGPILWRNIFIREKFQCRSAARADEEMWISAHKFVVEVNPLEVENSINGLV